MQSKAKLCKEVGERDDHSRSLGFMLNSPGKSPCVAYKLQHKLDYNISSILSQQPSSSCTSHEPGRVRPTLTNRVYLTPPAILATN
jgi:hypothetical protein